MHPIQIINFPPCHSFLHSYVFLTEVCYFFHVCGSQAKATVRQKGILGKDDDLEVSAKNKVKKYIVGKWKCNFRTQLKTQIF